MAFIHIDPRDIPDPRTYNRDSAIARAAAVQARTRMKTPALPIFRPKRNGVTIYERRIGPRRPAVINLDKLTVDACVAIVSKLSGVSVEHLMSEARPAYISQPRQVAQWLARRFTNKSFLFIGKALGQPDHSSAVKACERVDLALENSGAVLAPLWGPIECARAVMVVMKIELATGA